MSYATTLEEVLALRSEVARLRKGVQDFLDGNYENPRQHRPEKCSHGQYWYQGCDQCDEAHFTALISPALREGNS